MNCPHCKDVRLEPKELELGLVAASCSQCGGALLSLMFYRYWLEHYAAKEAAEEQPDSPEPVEAEDTQSALCCPKCTRLMTKFQVGPDTDHRLDLCTTCDEAWLDKGEWRLLKQLDLHGKLPKIFTDAWQRNIRLQRQEQRQNERFRDLLGDEDFERAEAFKQWLNQHPNKIQIRQFLSIEFQ
ncbi:hypothetical protein [Pseudomaricurvus alkylphenolicus]|uniref:TFIIB-type zinc ribbon-containing protein n=1 Tax=Pseudomaricurvus alkylphenolicus TaxID=1306991 RepID=UPI00197E6CE6|nr:hypothetical protein [Pseudomaricurvus alkylphenolicus]